MILALAGGVGGAKLANGLSMVLDPRDLLTVVNTGDDFTHLGLHVSPDLDTVMYWFAGINDPERGWGIAKETWRFMAALDRVGGPTWFRLGDTDLATHAERTRQLATGIPLSDVTKSLCRALNIRHPIAPMTDGQLRTQVRTPEGILDFQDYFVRQQCQPTFLSVIFSGSALPTKQFHDALANENLDAIVFCPSNPILSIGPILAVEGVRSRIGQHPAPVIAISPLVGGQAIKGPAAKIFRELGLEPSALEIARHYADIIDGIIIDETDSALRLSIEQLGLRVLVAQTVMRTPQDQQALAFQTLAFARSLRAIVNA